MAEHAIQQASGAGSSRAADEGQIVVFRLGDEEFGVDIGRVKEIVRLPEVTPMPRSPEYVAGICNLRGNVLPVIHTRLRFRMEPVEATEHSRLLVVDINGNFIGLIVDAMREVMRMKQSLVEPPPDVCQGVNHQFLKGVMKVEDGERLIMMLELQEVVTVEAAADRSLTSSQQRKKQASEITETLEEENLVSFNVSGEEYAFDIAKVREILKVPEITIVPNMPRYVKGLFTVRNQLLPVLGLRQMLGLPSLVEELADVVDKGMAELTSWSESLTGALGVGGQFAGGLSTRETSFGKWLETYDTSSVEIENGVKVLKRERERLFASAAKALGLRGESDGDTENVFESQVKPLVKITLELMRELKQTVITHACEDQRVMVVEANGIHVGYMVDSVNEVMRIPRSAIDHTPALASSQHQEIKSVAKLDHGDRLVMIMDETSLISQDTSRELNDLKKRDGGSGMAENGNRERTLDQQSLDEEQLVTFSIDGQEYGIQIMKVQEINRASDITSVPRAPRFIDGVTNLRGNVIPVVNVRQLFGLESKEIDDRTRIIIVDISGSKTGLRVDGVNEVLRLAKTDIESTPPIITASGANRYMTGVCKIDAGKRMIVLLDVEKILQEEEVQALAEAAGLATVQDPTRPAKILSQPPEHGASYDEPDGNAVQ